MKLSSVSIAELIGSSTYIAIADDSAKDEDNAAWVMFLPEPVRKDYIELIGWIRQIDRMAENEWVEGWGSRFQIFRIGWRTLLVTHFVLPDDYHAKLLLRMYRRWFARRSFSVELSVIHAWDEYVEATGKYHRFDMVFDTIADYKWMLDHLGGSMFQVLSFLTDTQRRAVRAFGVVDLFFNHLRDLGEDTAQGLCYFPTDVLERFGVDRQEILDGSCFRNVGYPHMMRFWLDDFLPHLYRQAAEFLNDTQLHYSWQILRHWFLRRHARLQRALRVSGMDFRAATSLYYAEVPENLSRWIEESFAVAGCADLLHPAASEPSTADASLPTAASAIPQSQISKEISEPLLLDTSVPPGDSGSGWLVLGRQRRLRKER